MYTPKGRGRKKIVVYGPSAFKMLALVAVMSDQFTPSTNIADHDLTPVEHAHSIIESLLDHTRVVSDLIALMAQALDQDTTKALTLTPQWQAYLESRRRMERTREEVERFAEKIKRIGED